MTTMDTLRGSTYSIGSEPSLAAADEVPLRRESRLPGLRPPLPVERLSPATKRTQIWAIYLIGFIDFFSVSMMLPLLPRFMRLLGASPSLAGLIGSLYGALQVFSSPAVGKLSDVYGRKPILLASYLVPALGYLLNGFSGALIFVAIARVPNGFLKHGLSISRAYLTDITDMKERQAVLGMFSAYIGLGSICGPLLSGYLADWDQTLQLSMFCGTAIFTLNIFLVWFLVHPLHVQKSSANQDKARGDLQDMLSLGHLLSSLNIVKGISWKRMGDVIVVRFLMTFAFLMFQNNLTIFLQEHFEVDYKTLGKIMSFNGIATVVAGVMCGHISQLYSSHTKQLVHFVTILGVSILGVTCAPNVMIVGIFLMPLSVAVSTNRICSLSLMLTRVTEKEKGAVIGLHNSISSVSRMFSPSLVGAAQEIGSELAGYVSAGLAMMAATAMVIHPLDKPQPIDAQDKEHKE